MRCDRHGSGPPDFLHHIPTRSLLPGRRTRLPVAPNDVQRASIRPISIFRIIRVSVRPSSTLPSRRAELAYSTALAAFPCRPPALVDGLAHFLILRTILLSIYPTASCPRWLPSTLVNCPIEPTRTTSTSPF